MFYFTNYRIIGRWNNGLAASLISLEPFDKRRPHKIVKDLPLPLVNKMFSLAQPLLVRGVCYGQLLIKSFPFRNYWQCFEEKLKILIHRKI